MPIYKEKLHFWCWSILNQKEEVSLLNQIKEEKKSSFSARSQGLIFISLSEPSLCEGSPKNLSILKIIFRLEKQRDNHKIARFCVKQMT